VNEGESNKTLETARELWNFLSEHYADRNSLLLNLGGGVITDLGGFVAATYKRGISFLHLPTTLLSMVDASIGGKCGVNFQGFKNQVGVFQQPNGVLLYPPFLNSLAKEEWQSGKAEMIKHALIADSAMWKQIKHFRFEEQDKWSSLIESSATIKMTVVNADPLEKGYRKVLNYGHTVGHALESVFMHKEKPLSHGYAIAIGMQIEAYLAHQICGLNLSSLEEIDHYLTKHYPKVKLEEADQKELINFLKQDKKNESGHIKMSLLDTIGKANFDQTVSIEQAKQGIQWYLEK
jgi:3-dehydroquinate synthase